MPDPTITHETSKTPTPTAHPNGPPTTYDPAWYTWSTFFSILVGTASYPTTARYIHSKSILNESRDCARCSARLTWLFQYSPIVRFLSEKTSQLGGNLEPGKNVICKRCDTLSPRGAKQGAFDGEMGILMCANHLRSRGQTEDVLAHEMVHAWDWLRWRVERGNLRHLACTEIRASTLSGECRWVREFFANHQFKFTQQFQECVRRRAVTSVKMSEECKDDSQAVNVVNEVWDSCFTDTRPFDEIYR